MKTVKFVQTTVIAFCLVLIFGFQGIGAEVKPFGDSFSVIGLRCGQTYTAIISNRWGENVGRIKVEGKCREKKVIFTLPKNSKSFEVGKNRIGLTPETKTINSGENIDFDITIKNGFVEESFHGRELE